MTETSTDIIRKQQADTLSVLDGLLTIPLPIVFWKINDVSPSHLSGQIYRDGKDDQVRGAIDAWAQYLNADVQEEPQPTYTAVRVAKEYEGVTIEVWGHVNDRLVYEEPEPAELPDGPVAGRAVA